MLTYHNDDRVTLHGLDRRPLKLPFRVWLRITDRAIALVEAALARGVKTPNEATPDEKNAKRWLQACWERRTLDPGPLKLSELIADWKARRHLLDLPPDPSRIVRCCRCNSPLTDPVSKLLGIGPVCRDPRKAAVRPQRALVAT